MVNFSNSLGGVLAGIWWVFGGVQVVFWWCSLHDAGKSEINP
jgi:hypothetical protein